ncbi:MAG: hypothetical protein A2Y15_01140 [Clostridiales bacterium GWF2_36_10]|nr:MAG: hypothetical protein A2Y15_01140 [Clostridiales bacterium GWF2_36_10]
MFCFLFPQTVFAHTLTTQYDWYFKPKGINTRPVVFDNKEFPEKYGTISIGSPDEKIIYLTFDAGYASDNLVKILDILKEQNVTAAFFILPAVIEKKPEVAERLAKDGHIVANHSFSHKNMVQITDKETFLKEITDLEEMYYSYTGYQMSKYFRPPAGRFSEQNLMYCYEEGYTPTFWSFAYADWDNNAQKKIEWAKKKILDNVHNGMVMLLHPNSETNTLILNDVINECRAQGYRFGTLDELKAYYDSKKAD